MPLSVPSSEPVAEVAVPVTLAASAQALLTTSRVWLTASAVPAETEAPAWAPSEAKAGLVKRPRASREPAPTAAIRVVRAVMGFVLPF